MDRVEFHFEKRVRDRVYSDKEIAAIWNAANGLADPIWGAYVKLLVLLAPRKTALALARWSDLDDANNPTVWVTPPELTKTNKTDKRRVYRTPLSALAGRVIRGIARGAGDALFPTLYCRTSKAGRRVLCGEALVRELIRAGAPKDFAFHTVRHTIATHLQNAGHSTWEVSLVLNHAGSGVTAGYQHGHALDLKRKLLEEWAGHVETLVTVKGVRVLR